MSYQYTPPPVVPQERYVEIETMIYTGLEGGVQTPRRITVSIPVRHIHLFSEDIDNQSLPVVEEPCG